MPDPIVNKYEDLPRTLATDPHVRRIVQQRKQEEGIVPPRAIDFIEAFLIQHGVKKMLLEPVSDTMPGGTLSCRVAVSFVDGGSHPESADVFVQLFNAFNVSFLRYGIDVDVAGEPLMAVGFKN